MFSKALASVYISAIAHYWHCTIFRRSRRGSNPVHVVTSRSRAALESCSRGEVEAAWSLQVARVSGLAYFLESGVAREEQRDDKKVAGYSRFPSESSV